MNRKELERSIIDRVGRLLPKWYDVCVSPKGTVVLRVPEYWHRYDGSYVRTGQYEHLDYCSIRAALLGGKKAYSMFYMLGLDEYKLENKMQPPAKPDEIANMRLVAGLDGCKTIEELAMKMDLKGI